MTCSRCVRVHPSAVESIEFGCVVCDACYERALIDKQSERQQHLDTLARRRLPTIHTIVDPAAVWAGHAN